jgi:ubiquitin-protein ligase
MSLSVGEKRLLKDVININKHPLTDQGIYYIHDADNIKKGYALIIGPKETIYSHGMYFFEFTYPDDYPFAPPHVEYLTNGDKIRFNPNLYRSGKVCISILNTWSGPQWSSCQTISSILLTLITLFHNKPLLNEPGVNESYPGFKTYNKIIRYASIKIALIDVLTGKICATIFDKFKPDILNYIKTNRDEITTIINKIDETLSEESTLVLSVGIYGTKCKCKKKGTLLKKINSYYAKIDV